VETIGSKFSSSCFRVNSVKELSDLEDGDNTPRIVPDPLLKFVGIYWKDP
jgi:hypothetical protein